VGEDHEARVEVDGLQIRCSRRPGAGRPLLLVNGMGANVEMWEPFRGALRGRPTIAFDAPGTGESGTPLRPWSIRKLASLTVEVLDHLGVGEVDVVGYSFGGAVAQELARAEPVRVRRVVLAATTCGWGGFPPEPLALAALLSPARYYAGAGGHAFTRVAFGDPDSIDLRRSDAAREQRPPSLLGYYWQALAMASWSSWPWLGELTQPVLVIAGAHDRVVPRRTAELLARRIPRSRLVVLPGAGHSFLLAENVDPVAHIVTGFLDGSVDGSVDVSVDGSVDGSVEVPDQASSFVAT
jgi:poly(3-hydroxyoctanoate) depolymerase